jgi:hemerythrin superfamily protein
MNLLDALHADHEEVKSMLKAILGTEDAKQRTEQFREFKAAMTAHSRAEEKVLYHRMQKAEEGRSKAFKGETEHEIVDHQMDELSRSRPKDSDRWTARCSVLRELIEHHVEEEEGEFFKTAQKLFGEEDLEMMGKEFETEKQRHHPPKRRAA